MSVLIKGMKMPKNCTECPFFIKSNSPKYPFVDCKLIGRLGSIFNCIDIPVDCPLVEIHTHHGRLIDADALTVSNGWVAEAENYRTHITFVYEYDIVNAPTIIEAEVDG